VAAERGIDLDSRPAVKTEAGIRGDAFAAVRASFLAFHPTSRVLSHHCPPSDSG